MAIRFVLGTSGSGKTRECIDAIAEHLRRQDNLPLVFLVPEQATFQVERAILSCSGISGYSRLRVTSFNRLQFWLCGSLSENDLSSNGRRLMVRRALSACTGLLGLLHNETSSGFSAAISDLIRRLHEDNCTPAILSAAAGQLLAKDPANLTGRKLADLAIIYKHYLELIDHPDNMFFNPDSALTEARTKVKAAAFLQGARIWVDGFSGFTLQQQDLLFEMLAICSDADIALCLDPQTIDLENTDPEKLDPSSLFAPTERTYAEMLAVLRRQNFKVSTPVILNHHPRFESVPALAHIERCFFDSETDCPVQSNGAIEIIGLTDVRSEADYVAQSISSLMRSTSLRYRDIAVIVPCIDAYAHYLAAAFDRNTIPYFLDRPQSIQSHPLIELLTATLRVIQSRFDLPKMLALLKNRLRLIDDSAADRLENYCRAFGITGQDWFSDQPWTFEDNHSLYQTANIDKCRRTFIAPLQELAAQFTGSLIAADAANALFVYLDALDVPKRLAAQSQDDPTDMQFANRRVWKKWLEATTECSRIFDGQSLCADEWIDLLLDALSGLSLKLIPPAADQVLIGSIERSRHPDIKIVFLVGASNARFPVPLAGEELLTEQDIRLAAAAKLPLTHPRQQALDARRYLSYIAMTRASEKIFITFPTLDEKGATNTYWTGIDRLIELFPDVSIQYGPGQTAAPQRYSIQALTEWLCAALGQDSTADESLRRFAREFLACCQNAGDDVIRQTAEQVNSSLAWRNTAELDSEIRGTLFQWPMRTSASRIKSFAVCPYQYFAKHLLRLEPREMLRMDVLDIGTFYHTVLKKMFLQLRQDGQDWTTVNDENLFCRARQIAKTVIAESPAYAAYIRQSRHNAFILQQAVERLCRFLPAIKAISAAGVFRQTAAEYEFSEDKLAFMIEPGQTILFKGYIDRVDCAHIEGRLTGIVFDYKTSDRKMDWGQFFNGLDLQLPVYLLALRNLSINHRSIEQIAGAFYLPIESKPKDADYTTLKTAAPAIKARGLLNARFVDALDAQCEKHSKYYAFAYNKENEPYSDYNRKDVLRPEEFEATLAFAENKIRELTARLVSGDIRAFPYRLAGKSPCEHCDYRPVCKFDWQLNDYNLMHNLNKEQTLAQILQVSR